MESDCSGVWFGKRTIKTGRESKASVCVPTRVACSSALVQPGMLRHMGTRQE